MINAFNMVRMGLARAHSSAIYKSPKYGSAWTMKTPEELRGIYTELVTLLKERPYGPYKAIVMIFGTAVADRLASNHSAGIVQCPKPPGRPSKRKAIEEGDTEGDHDDDEDFRRPSGSRRRGH
jgi:hypothetical protein